MPRQYTIHKENDLLQQNEISKVILYPKNKHQKEAISHKDASAQQEKHVRTTQKSVPVKNILSFKETYNYTHIIIQMLLKRTNTTTLRDLVTMRHN